METIAQERRACEHTHEESLVPLHEGGGVRPEKDSVPTEAEAAAEEVEDSLTGDESDILGSIITAGEAATTSSPPSRRKSSRRRRRLLVQQESKAVEYAYNFLLHLCILGVYLLPMLQESSQNKGNPVLDELHMVSKEQRDVYDVQATWTQIFTNDYWGRPMNNPSSHKSWRPLTVLTFRFFRELPFCSHVLGARLWNIITHAAIAEGVGILARRLVPQHAQPRLFQRLAKVIFALHPTHVEVTANAANRPHLLAVLWAVWLCEVPLWTYPFLLLAGYLSSETFLFSVVPIAVTRAILMICDNEVRHTSSRDTSRRPWLLRLLGTWLILGGSGLVYYGLRYHWDWLSIPDGLIRPAENPFFRLKGWDRVRSYAYVTVVHIAKAWDWDMVGFSHEYGRACITPITTWEDPRLFLTGAVLGAYAVITLAWTRRVFLLWKLPRQTQQRRTLPYGFLLWVMHLSWMVTLFPITGIVKVGTFVSDRIAVPASVGTSILTAYWLSNWLLQGRRQKQSSSSSTTPASVQWSYREYLVLLVFCFSWRRLHQRTSEWMDAVPLLESSLRTCPRSAKSHLEYSKTLSGLYPSRTNLTTARWHLEQVEAIDSEYCDVHQQFAHVAIQEHAYLEFEERLTQALVCKFTVAGAMDMWRRYWPLTLDPLKNSEASIAAAQLRQEKYLEVVNAAVAAEEAAEKAVQSASPLIWNKG
jgi:hypothetical protein